MYLIRKYQLMFLFLLSFPVYSAENDMKLLSDYLTEKGDDIEDRDMLYVNYRCLGLYSMLFGLIDNRPFEDSEDIKILYEEASYDLYRAGEYLYEKLTPKTERDFDEDVKKSVIPIADKYMLEAINSKKDTDSYFNDFIDDEVNVCSIYLNAIRDENR